MPELKSDDVTLHYQLDGAPNGAPVMFANSLGTDLHLWDGVVERLPKELLVLRYDMRGHGKSSVPEGPYKMGTLIHDAERILDHVGIRECVFVGLSVGGIVAQGLATKRVDQIRAMVLSNTAAKIGTPQMWQDRIDTIGKSGLEAAADMVMERWFSKKFCNSPEVKPWRDMLVSTPLAGYLGVCAAISGTDFFTPTAALRLPTLGIAGSQDSATPPDMVRETTNLIPGSRFELMRDAGHLPCAQRPDEYTEILTRFLREIGHL